MALYALQPALLEESRARLFLLSLLNALFTALVYGVPLAPLFLRRSLESAIGYHFFIDLVRFGNVILVLHG